MRIIYFEIQQNWKFLLKDFFFINENMKLEEKIEKIEIHGFQKVVRDNEIFLAIRTRLWEMKCWTI